MKPNKADSSTTKTNIGFLKKCRTFLVMCLVFLMGFVPLGCDAGINDIPPTMLPGNEEGQDTLMYLANMLIDNYKDTIIDQLRSALINELDAGTFDEFIDTQFDSLMDKVITDNKDMFLDEMKDMLKDQTTGESGIFSDEEILELIRENLIDNGELKDILRADLISEFSNPDSQFQKDLIPALIGNPEFLQTLMEDDDFIGALASNPEFLQALTSNSAFVDALFSNPAFMTKLFENEDFKTKLKEIILETVTPSIT